MRKIIILVMFMVISVFAKDFAKYVDDIEGRFDKAYTAYNNGEFDKAKKGFQLAYFEVFENLEGPIRINVSAKKSYAMEAQFTDLRKMVVGRVSKEKLKSSIDALIKEMREVLPELQTHQLVAEVGDDVKAADAQNAQPAKSASQTLTFDPNWSDALSYIQDDFKKALDAYSSENSKPTRDLIKDAQFEGYRNSGLETMIRTEKSSKKEGEIQSTFPALVAFVYTKPSRDELRAKFDESMKTLVAVSANLAPYNKAKPKKKKAGAKDYSPTVAKIKENFLKAFKMADSGQKEQAISLIQDTYFDVFEASGMENAIGAKDANLKTNLEGYFGKTLGALKKDAKDAERMAILNEFMGKLQNALEILHPKSSTPWSLFIYSLTIILREGMEALLIVTAIIAYLIKSGNEKRMGIVYSSLTVAIILSFATAWVMNIIFGQAAGQNRELLEGATMLVAAFLLFYVSYWLLSNAQAKKWNDYIKSHVSESLSSGSVKALWFTVFLAVYREGAETVLFYQALFSEATSGQDYTYLTSGFILGVVLLLIIYFIIRYTAVKIPIKPFFILTGIFIYFMCFMFVGQGVSELVEGRVFVPNLVSGIPTITTVGIYPYMESLIPQGVAIILGIIGAYFIYRKKTRV